MEGPSGDIKSSPEAERDGEKRAGLEMTWNSFSRLGPRSHPLLSVVWIRIDDSKQVECDCEQRSWLADLLYCREKP